MRLDWIKTNVSDTCNGLTFKTGTSYPMGVIHFSYEAQKGDLISIYGYDGNDPLFSAYVTTGQSLMDLMEIVEFVYNKKVRGD